MWAHFESYIIYTPSIIAMFSQILQAQDYYTSDPYVRDAIDQDIRKQLNNFGTQLEAPKGKKGKSSHEQILNNLRTTTGDKFKYLWTDDNALDYDYEEEQKLKRDKELQLIEPAKFEVLGYNQDSGPDGKRRPVMRMSDAYRTCNPKVRRLINRVFDRHIYGRQMQKTHDGGVMIAKSTSNYQQLEQILKNYQNQDDDFNIAEQEVNMNEKQLEEYIIDRGQSKSSYFLFYRNEQAPKRSYNAVNNPLKSEHFLKRLHQGVRQKERQYYRIEDVESEEEEQLQQQKAKEKKEEEKKKQYFGQFKKSTKTTTKSSSFRIEDHVENNVQSGQQIARAIIDHYNYLDSDLIRQKYKEGKEVHDRLELNLSNPHFFQPKLHTILTRQTELMHENQFKARIAEANKNRNEKSILSGNKGQYSRLSAHASEAPGVNPENQEEKMTIDEFVNAEIKNISREPIKHSDIANKFEFVKFTLEEDVFHHYHRHFFPFQEHLNNRAIVDVHVEKMRKTKANGLVINAEMKESNDKFCRKEDLSCTKGEFILVEYIEETPILMSDVGMCERMFIQVNYQEILQKMKEQIFNVTTLDDMEDQRDKLENIHISYRKHAPLWRKMIKQIFGQNGKQFYWEPRLNTGKVIGTPEGPGVIAMESNLGTVPLVRKKTPTRDFLLVRQGKKWVLRRIDNVYVSGQFQPGKKVFCPGSRQHTDFKLSYERAYVVRQIKQYGTVNLDQLKLTFKGETENSLRKALKSCNAISRDSKNFKIIHEIPPKSEHILTPEDICLYERMQKSLCQLKEVGIHQIRSNEKMKNVLKEFNRQHYQHPEKITIARVIREQLQLTSWYLTDSFLKYKQRASKIEINGFADPTNGRGGYSFINKPQKERTAREDMEERQEKQKSTTLSDLRKLNCESSRQQLREMGYNEDEIEDKGRWQLINLLKNKEGTQFSRRQRETKFKKLQNEKKEISKNFNRLLNWLRDELEEPAFDYNRIHSNKLEHYLRREQEYIEKIKRRHQLKLAQSYSKADEDSDDSEDMEG